jgi:hypothetical protein
MNNYTWTSVKDGLPTEKGEYLVTRGSSVFPCKFIPHYNEDDDPNENVNLSFGDHTKLKHGDPVWYYTDNCVDDWGLVCDRTLDGVIAWMEFPKPYKGEQ